MGSDTHGESNESCKGEWINDCPYPECKCAQREAQKIMDEDYGNEAYNTAMSAIGWGLLLIFLIGASAYGIVKLLWFTAH